MNETCSGNSVQGTVIMMIFYLHLKIKYETLRFIVEQVITRHDEYICKVSIFLLSETTILIIPTPECHITFATYRSV